MTPSAPAPASPDVGTPPGPPAAPPAAPPRRRRWGRRLLMVVGAITLVVLALRLAAWIAVPIALDLLAHRFGLDLLSRDVSISILRGEVELSGVRAVARDGAPRVLEADYVRADLAMLPLLRGELVLDRVEVEGVDVSLDRGLHDQVELLRLIDEALRPLLGPHGPNQAIREARVAAEDAADALTSPARGGPLEVDLPVEVRRLVVRHLRARLRDPLVTPPVDVTLDVTVELAGLEVGARGPLMVALAVDAAPLLTLRAGGQARLEHDRLEATLRVAATGIHADAIEGWLRAAGVRVLHDEVELFADASILLRPAIDDPRLTAATIALDRLVVRGDGEVVLSADRAELELDRPGEGFLARRLELVGVRGTLTRDPVASAVEVSGVRVGLTEEEEEEDDEPDAPIALHDVVVRDLELTFFDHSIPGGLALPIRIDSLRLRGVDSRAPDQPGRVAIVASLPGTARAVTVNGKVWPFEPFLGADVEVALRGLTLEALAPTLLAAGLRPSLRDGELTASVRVLLRGEDDGPTTLQAHVERLRLTDGGAELVALEVLSAPSIHVDPVAGQVRAAEVLVRGPRLEARRDAEGRLHVAGVSLEAERRRPVVEVVTAAEEDDDAAPLPDWLHWRLQVARLDVSGVSAILVDEAAPGGAPITLAVPEAGLLVEDLDLDLAPEALAGPSARLAAWVAAPGIVERFAITGTADAGRGRLTVALEVEAEGLTLDALRPYLRAADVDTLLGAGRLQAALSAEATFRPGGAFDARCALERLRLTDGSRRLLLVDDLRAEGFSARPAANGPPGYGLDRLELRRLDLPVRLGADGSVTLLGLRLERSSAPLDPDPDPEEKAREGLTGPLLQLPKLALGGVDLERVTVRIEDERRPGDDLQMSLELAVGALRFDPASAVLPPATPFALRLRAPGAADVLRLGGGFSLSPDLVRLEALLTGQGLTERFVASIPGLHTQDVAFDEAHLRVRAAGEVRREGEALAARVDLGPLTLADRGGELLGLDLATAEGSLGPAGLRVEDLHVRRPRVRVVRAGPDEVRVAGLLLATDGEAVVEEDASEDVALTLPRLPAVHVERARVTGLEVGWTDLAVAPALEQLVTLDLVAHDVSTGAAPGDVRVVVTAPGAVDRVVIGGKVALTRERFAAELALAAQGVRSTKLATYAPGLTLEDGRARATLAVDVSERDDGGLFVRASLRDAEVRDGDHVLLAAPGLWLDAPRIDPARLIDVDLLQAEVDVLEVTREGGVLTVAGVPFGGAGEDDAAPPAPPPAPTPPTGPAEVARIGAAPPPVVRPLLKVGALDLVVRRLRFADVDAGRATVEARDLRLRSLAPFETLGPPGRDLATPSLELTGAVSPLVRALRLRLTGDPLVNDPELEVRLQLEGLRGEGLTAVAPELIETLDGRGLTDGYLDVGGRVILRTRRSDPLDPSIVSRGFGARVELFGLTLHEGGPRGSLLLAVGEAFADVDWLSPERGRLDLRLLEVYRPRLVITRFPEGIQVGGLLIKQRPDEPEEEDEGPPENRVHVRQLSLVDVELTFEDRTVSPPFVLPIRGLELDVSGLDTHAGHIAGLPPIMFNLLAFSGPVALPPRPERGLSRVSGAVSSVVRLLNGDDDRERVEHRPLFDEFTARGVFETFPDLHGKVRATLRSFEVRGLIGLAAKSGIDVSDGVVDLDVVIDLGPGGEGDVQLGAVIQDLSLTEPRQGPIVRLLQVPVSLDAVLFVLRDDRGAIRLSVDAEVPPDGELERGEILGAVAEAIGEQALRALRSAPLRVLNPIVWLIDLLTPGELMGFRDKDLEPLRVLFDPGSSDLDRAQRIAVERLADRLERDDELVLLLRHELGTDDRAPLARITGPEPAHDRDLIARLAIRRAELLWRRSDLEARIRSAFGAGAHADAQVAIAELQRTEATLGRLERALAGAQDRVGSRSDRVAQRRARAAALVLAEARMVAVREALCAAGLREVDRRVRLGPARYVAASETLRGLVIATPQEELVESEEVPDIRGEGESPELGGP